MDIFSIIIGIILFAISVSMIIDFFRIHNRVFEIRHDMRVIVKLLKSMNKQIKVQTTILTKMINDIDENDEEEEEEEYEE